ncbi:MFS transporter [Penicillium brasilianum]|uniref:MFS transporter n=1 Tax=Penicillium brasilianum TaxID=104259 RepID=A0A1S9RXB9_PENBI|nr:MFS transporter [Penicillium brasilianum]
MTGSYHKTARTISVVAGTLVALSCGTNYAYSAWAPQFAHRMKLSSTESNLIGAAGNLGMYAMGIPMGLLTDARGPRLITLIGSILLALGYYPIYLAYQSGEGSVPIIFLCFFAFLTGTGGCSAFGGAIKTAASNFPDHRGTATAFPLAAFGLSALFWSNVSTLIFKEDTGRFLLLLALGTSILSFCSIPLLRIFPVESYSSLPHHGPGDPGHSQRMRRASNVAGSSDEHNSTAFDHERSAHARTQSTVSNHRASGADSDETSSLVSKPDGRPSFDTLDDDFLGDVAMEAHHTDIRGLVMLRHVEFWQLFLTMALLSGIGLMTINNIGNSAKALWIYYDDSATSKFIHQRQVMHVSILSFCNFLGRLSSGIGSDILVKKLNMSRFWCLLISAVVFTLTQLAGSSISNPNTLVVVSAFTGVAYGFLFGVFPSLTAHTFGIGGLSQNWGVMTLAPVFSGNVFNLIYGTVYDRHSIIGHEGDRECPDGLACYRSAYYLTFFSGLAGICVCLWSIFRERQIHNVVRKKTSQRLA